MEWSCQGKHFIDQEVLISHANAALTPRHRLRIARLIVDRSSRPHHSPNRTSHELVRKVVHLRWKKRLGPVAIGWKLGMPASTVHAVLTRCRLNKLHHVDIRTGEVVRRYEHDHPGSMIHIDVTKFGNIPTGGGHRFVGRPQGNRNRSDTLASRGEKRWHGQVGKWASGQVGKAFVHTVIDDHSRVAYAEIHDDEKAVTAVGVLHRYLRGSMNTITTGPTPPSEANHPSAG